MVDRALFLAPFQADQVRCSKLCSQSQSERFSASYKADQALFPISNLDLIRVSFPSSKPRNSFPSFLFQTKLQEKLSDIAKPCTQICHPNLDPSAEPSPDPSTAPKFWSYSGSNCNANELFQPLFSVSIRAFHRVLFKGKLQVDLVLFPFSITRFDLKSFPSSKPCNSIPSFLLQTKLPSKAKFYCQTLYPDLSPKS